MARILHTASERSHSLLAESRDDLEQLARALLDREELDDREIAELIGPSVHHKKRQGNSKEVGQVNKDSVADPEITDS